MSANFPSSLEGMSSSQPTITERFMVLSGTYLKNGDIAKAWQIYKEGVASEWLWHRNGRLGGSWQDYRPESGLFIPIIKELGQTLHQEVPIALIKACITDDGWFRKETLEKDELFNLIYCFNENEMFEMCRNNSQATRDIFIKDRFLECFKDNRLRTDLFNSVYADLLTDAQRGWLKPDPVIKFSQALTEGHSSNDEIQEKISKLLKAIEDAPKS